MAETNGQRGSAGVLFVEDDPDLRAVMVDLFDSLNVGSVIAASLDEVRRHEERALACAVAILDVNLGPGEPSGVDVSSWLRERGFRGDLIFLTGYASQDPRVQAATSVPDSRVMNKPLSFKALAGLVAPA